MDGKSLSRITLSVMATFYSSNTKGIHASMYIYDLMVTEVNYHNNNRNFEGINHDTQNSMEENSDDDSVKILASFLAKKIFLLREMVLEMNMLSMQHMAEEMKSKFGISGTPLPEVPHVHPK